MEIYVTCDAMYLDKCHETYYVVLGAGDSTTESETAIEKCLLVVIVKNIVVGLYPPVLSVTEKSSLNNFSPEKICFPCF